MSMIAAARPSKLSFVPKGLVPLRASQVKAFSPARPSVTHKGWAKGPATCAMGAESAMGPSVPLTPSYKAASEWGLEPEHGVFGFRPFAELWVGRLAMLGFTIGLEEELRTGNGILAQLSLMQDGAPSPVLFFALLGGMGGASLLATVGTLIKLQRGDMTVNQFMQYANFFGFSQEQAALAAANALKNDGDFTSPDNLMDIDAARQNMPADKFLAQDDLSELASTSATMRSDNGILGKLDAAEVDAAASELKRVESASQPGRSPDAMWLPETSGMSGLSAYDELAYAKLVEVTNGRWAMVGFALTILIESATGYGTLPQLFYYFKLSGLLGPDSGF